MRFLLLNQFYPPDPAPTGWYLHGLARELVRRGHQVTVLCSRRSYDGGSAYPAREFLDGVEVQRLAATGFGRRGFAGKLTDYSTFYLSLGAALFSDRTKPDLVLSLTTPPYIGLLAKCAAWRYGCGHAHWIMDLYPDVIFAHQMTDDAGPVSQLLRSLTRLELEGAGTVLCLGARMAQKVANYVVAEKGVTPVTSVPLWSDPDLAPWPADAGNPLRAGRKWDAADVIFLYSGNMGLGHRFGEFLETARRFEGASPRWVFSGGGKRRGEVEAFARQNPDTRIEFLDYVPQCQLRAHLCAADVHLASLDPAWQGLIVPSKIQASFATARPVLFVGGHQCETADWIQESGGGWVVEQDDLDGLFAAVTQALDPAERQRRGQAACEFARKNFRMSTNCAQIARLLERGVHPQPLNHPAVLELNPIAARNQNLTQVL